jgi:hypothetical protein
VTDGDPVGHVRGKFKSASAFRRFVMNAGGNEAFSRGIAERAGWSKPITRSWVTLAWLPQEMGPQWQSRSIPIGGLAKHFTG